MGICYSSQIFLSEVSCAILLLVFCTAGDVGAGWVHGGQSTAPQWGNQCLGAQQCLNEMKDVQAPVYS